MTFHLPTGRGPVTEGTEYVESTEAELRRVTDLVIEHAGVVSAGSADRAQPSPCILRTSTAPWQAAEACAPRFSASSRSSTWYSDCHSWTLPMT